MKPSETNFRAFYRNFCIIPLKDDFKETIKDYPGADEANALLTYGYIDHEAGLTLDVLACAISENGHCKLFDTCVSTRYIIRIGAVENDNIGFLEDEDGSLNERYREKLEIIEDYDVSDEIEETRSMDFLDECRHEYYPDDILVIVAKDGLQLEGCWARLSGIENRRLKGILLNEPDQNFGCHCGEEIIIHVTKNNEERIVCYCDMDEKQSVLQ